MRKLCNMFLFVLHEYKKLTHSTKHSTNYIRFVKWAHSIKIYDSTYYHLSVLSAIAMWFLFGGKNFGISRYVPEHAVNSTDC